MLRALQMGMEHGTDSLDALLLLVRTSDPAELGDIAQRLASLDGVRSVDCSVAMAPPRA